MNWKCKLGFHDWIPMDKNREFEEWARNKSYVNNNSKTIFERNN